MYKSKERGITLVSLVVTIIIMLILSGIFISLFIGDIGIFKVAQESKMKQEIVQYEEYIKLSVANKDAEKVFNSMSSNEALNMIESELKNNNYFEKSKYKQQPYEGKPSLIITTKEGYVFVVFEDDVIYIGTTDEIDNFPDVSNALIEFKCIPSAWTNGSVEVTISTTSEYKIEYTIENPIENPDSVKWTLYQDKLYFEENETIYARLTNEIGSAKEYAMTHITNIDKVVPTISLNSSGVTTKDFRLEAEVTDSESGLGKIEWYYKKSSDKDYINETVIYKELNRTETGDTSATKTKEYTNLTAGTYNAYAVIYDVAGNANQSKTIEVTLGMIVDATGGSYTPTTWTNGKVTVTLPTKSGYTTVYSTSGVPTTSSTEYTESFTVEENTIIYYAYSDGTNVGLPGTMNVTNIDKTKPVVTGATSTTEKITITATDGASGIIGYAVTTSNTAPTSFTSCTSTKSLNVSVTGKAQGTTYYVWVKDAAGNVSASKSTATGEVETSTGGSYTPTTWTNGKVTVTLPTKSGYTTVYSTSGVPTTSSTKYTASFTVEENTIIYYAYSDGTNVGLPGTMNVTNIDKTKPVVTGATATTEKITITATDGASGIIGYAVTTSNTAPTSFTSCTSTKSLNVSVTGKAQGTTYYVWVKDAAGNVSVSKSTATKTIDVTAKASPTSWTNGNVTVTMTAANGGTIYYGTSISSMTTKYTAAFTQSANTTIYYYVTDGTNTTQSSYKSLNITNIDKTKPVVTGATATTENITITATDGASGIIGYAVTTSNTAPTSFTSCTSTKSLNVSVTGKAQGTTYYVWVKDAAGNVSASKSITTKRTLASQITIGNYGDYVNYNKNLGLSSTLDGNSSTATLKTQWRIFYEERDTNGAEKANGRVYLIAADYLPNTSSHINIDYIGMTKTTNSSFALYWSRVPSALSTVDRQDSVFGVSGDSYKLNSSYYNSRIVSVMLDTDNWKGFVVSTVADYAIGGPTIEMYANSWNSQGYNTISLTKGTAGYNLNGTNYIDMSRDTGYENNLYYPHQTAKSNCDGYWVTAPANNSSDHVMRVGYGGYISSDYYYDNRYALRPIVALKPGVTATKDANGVWQLDE